MNAISKKYYCDACRSLIEYGLHKKREILMSQNIEELKIKKILMSLEKVKEIYGVERFLSGDCANLILAMGKCLADIKVDFKVTIIDHFTSEDEDAEESEIYKEMKLPECFSHCYINVYGEDVDIKGLNAFENWVDWLNLPSEQDKWGNYELLIDILLEDDNPESLLNSLGIIADQSGVSVNYNFIEELTDLIKKELN